MVTMKWSKYTSESSVIIKITFKQHHLIHACTHHTCTHNYTHMHTQSCKYAQIHACILWDPIHETLKITWPKKSIRASTSSLTVKFNGGLTVEIIVSSVKSIEITLSDSFAKLMVLTHVNFNSCFLREVRKSCNITNCKRYLKFLTSIPSEI